MNLSLKPLVTKVSQLSKQIKSRQSSVTSHNLPANRKLTRVPQSVRRAVDRKLTRTLLAGPFTQRIVWIWAWQYQLQVVWLGWGSSSQGTGNLPLWTMQPQPDMRKVMQGPIWVNWAPQILSAQIITYHIHDKVQDREKGRDFKNRFLWLNLVLISRLKGQLILTV